MSRKDKLIKELENNPTNIRFETFEKLLLINGFVLKSVKGSHHTFTNGKGILTLPYHKPMKIYYVKETLKAIRELQ